MSDLPSIGSGVKTAGTAVKLVRPVAQILAAFGVESADRFDERLSNVEARDIAYKADAKKEGELRAIRRHNNIVLKEQENLEAVVIEANANLLELTKDDIILEDDMHTPSDDWSMRFIREAKMASSDELRSRLAKLLAGEIRKPGSYSPASIRAIAELDRETLEIFKEILPRRFSSDAIIRPVNTTPHLGLSLLPEEEELSHFYMLQEAGLMKGSVGSCLNIQISDEGRHVSRVESSKGLFALCFSGVPGTEIAIGAYAISKIGEEVASVLNISPDPKALQPAIDKLDKRGIDTIFHGESMCQPDGSYQIANPTILWSHEEEEKKAKEAEEAKGVEK